MAYIDARDVMDRLDEVVGAGNWTNVVDDHGTSATASLSIYCPFRDKWIHKTDGAGDTSVEKDKGRLSDAFKRAAVHWGIGRYLYNLDTPWVPIEKRGRSKIIPAAELSKLRDFLEEVTNSILSGGEVPQYQQHEVVEPAPMPTKQEASSEAAGRRETAQRAQTNAQPITEKQIRMLFAKARSAGESRSVHGYRVMDDALTFVGLPRTPRGEDIRQHVEAVVGRNYMDSLVEFIDSYGEDEADEFKAAEKASFEDTPDTSAPF